MFLSIDNGKFTMTNNQDSTREFELTDVTGPATFLCRHPRECDSILSSSSVDFPQDHGAPPDYDFEDHWKAICEMAESMWEKPE
jgi:hypothetical protein